MRVSCVALLLLICTGISSAVEPELILPTSNSYSEPNTLSVDENNTLYFSGYTSGSSQVWSGTMEAMLPLYRTQHNMLEHRVLNSKVHFYSYYNYTKNISVLMRTLDGGQTFTTLTLTQVGDFAVDGNRVWAIDNWELKFSDDLGDLWNEAGLSAYNLQRIQVDGSNIALASGITTGGEVYLSRDRGNTWKTIIKSGNFGFHTMISGIIFMTYSYYLGESSDTTYSSDYGATWKFFATFVEPYFMVSRGNYIYACNRGRGFAIDKHDMKFRNTLFQIPSGEIRDLIRYGDYLLLGTNRGVYRYPLPNSGVDWSTYR